MEHVDANEPDILEKIAIARDANDASKLAAPCGCDTSVGVVCEMCYTHGVLGEAGRKIASLLELQAKVEEVQQQNAELRAGANYVADREQRPTTVWFKNGRKVWIVNDADGAYLDVDWQSPCVVEDAGEDEVPHA